MITADQTYDLKQYMAPLLRYRSLIVAFVVAATLSSLVMTYVVSEKYQATTTVLYKPGDSVTFRPKAHDALGFPMPLVPLESIGNTLDELAHSDALLTQTVRELHLDEKAPYTGGAFMRAYRQTKDYIKELRGDAFQLLKYGRILPKDPFSDAVAGLKQNLKVKPSTKAYTFELQVIDTDPQRAAKTVDAVGRILSELLIRADSEAAHDAQLRLLPQLQQATNEELQLRDRIAHFKQKANVASLPDELSLRLKSASSFQDELAGVEHNLLSAEQKQKELADLIAAQPATLQYSATTTQNPVTDQLRRQIAQLQVERAGLLEKFTDKHPEVKGVDARIADATAELKRQDPRLVSSESQGINEVRQKLLADQLDTEAQIASLRAKKTALQQTVEDQAGQARRLTSKEAEQGDLNVQLAAAEKNFALVSEAYEEARVAEAKASSEVVMLNAALVPRAPVMPLKILHVGTSFLLSLLLAIGGVFIYDYLDPTVNYAYQFQAAIQAPILMALPAFSGDEVVQELLARSHSHGG